MSVYMSRLFPKSNSSFLLSSGIALKSKVTRLRDDMYLVDAGIGSPQVCNQKEFTKMPINATVFEDRVGYSDPVPEGSQIRKDLLERFIVDIVTAEQAVKEAAAARFTDLVGSVDAVPGEPHIMLPRRFRMSRAWTELNKIWRNTGKVKGIYLARIRAGYAVGIAGHIALLPRTRNNILYRRFTNDQFLIESIDPKTKKIVVL